MSDAKPNDAKSADVKPVKERAAALLASPSAKSEGFARRAAACYLLAGVPAVDGFDPSRVWPGAHGDFAPTDSAENARMAIALLTAERG